MDKKVNDPPSPGHSDGLNGTTFDDDHGLTTDSAPDNSLNQSPGHQGVYNTGGNDINMRVLYISNVNLSLDYQGLYLIMRKFGIIERMKLKNAKDKRSFVCYTTFKEKNSAVRACNDLNDHSINDSVIKTKLFSIKNLSDEPFDFIPKEDFDSMDEDIATREPPLPLWHVATYKDGKENLIKASECIESKVGNIPEENLKRYGRNILIKAGNDTQAILLSHFKAPESSNIESIKPHKTFNTIRGVIYSKELHEFSEDEIKERCPTSVYQVRKMKGNAILLTFTSTYIPDYLKIARHTRVKVKKYRPNPIQCHKCFEYGHTHDSCKNNMKCHICSAEHNVWQGCSSDRFCFHCEGNHSPDFGECPIRKFQKEVLEVANDLHISIGSAKKQVMAANRDHTSSYANAIKKLRSKANSYKTTINRRSSPPTPSSSDQQKSHTRPQNNQTLDSTPESVSTPAKMDTDTLPDLSVAVESDNNNASATNHSLDNPTDTSEHEAELPKSITVELPTSTVTVTKKNSPDSEGFISGKKRHRTNSPKKEHCEIETQNSYAILEESPMEKKQAVSVGMEPDEATSSTVAANPKDQGCRPKEAPNRKSNADETAKPTKKQESKIPLQSNQKSGRKTKFLKENFLKDQNERPSQSNKVGKKSF